MEERWQASPRDLRKATNYARGSVAVYWLVDLEDASITEFADPAEDGYGHARVLQGTDVIAVPETDERWVVADLFR